MQTYTGIEKQVGAKLKHDMPIAEKGMVWNCLPASPDT